MLIMKMFENAKLFFLLLFFAQHFLVKFFYKIKLLLKNQYFKTF